jgi:hypothetical protein
MTADAHPPVISVMLAVRGATVAARWYAQAPGPGTRQPRDWYVVRVVHVRQAVIPVGDSLFVTSHWLGSRFHRVGLAA